MPILDNACVSSDYGLGAVKYITEIECINSVILPSAYVKFILQHNGASILNEEFNFYDTSSNKVEKSFIAFIEIEGVQEYIDAKLFESSDEDAINYFPEKLIPFGESGNQISICFDYRNCRTDDPPIVIWNGNKSSNNIVFVANNFKNFVNMLHEPDDLDDRTKKSRQETREQNKQKEEKMRTEYIANRNKRFEQLKNPQPLTAEGKQSAKIDEELQKDLEYADRQ